MGFSKVIQASAVCVGSVLLMGCVLAEKYEAEKARALNFQRLLAQEEKRTGDLDSELKRVKREGSEMESSNRELTAQLQALREQLARIQEDATAMREAASLREKERQKQSSRQALTKAKRAPPIPGEPPKTDPKLGNGQPVYHEVKPGETIFRLSRQYGVDVKAIKEWNRLPDDLIEVGQKLIVGYE